MGRTKRKRLRRVKNQVGGNITDQSLINLQKWLKYNKWSNSTKLIIKNFTETGRGVTSTKSLRKHDTLIKIPYDVMITFTTIQTYFTENRITLAKKLTIQEFLVLFLMLERTNETSPWKEYIKSLPSELPDLPWLRSPDEVNLYPRDLQITSRKNRQNFDSSLERVRESIGEHLHCVSFEILFKWAYVLVNTRAVYVDPNVVWAINDSFKEFLIDKPSQALCPFLDMFNHHFHANTEANLRRSDDGLVYELTTLTSYKAYEQIMISYGPHSNDTLLMEYGFFIPGNIFDTVSYEILELRQFIRFNIDHKKYKFIKDHKFARDLSIGANGLSFNLKALFYILQNVDISKCSVAIFSDSYPIEFGEIVENYTDKLLNSTLNCFDSDLRHFMGIKHLNRDNKLLETYLRYKIHFVKGMLSKYR